MYGTHNDKPEGQLNSNADVMVSFVEDSGHPVCRASSALDRGFLEKKIGRRTIHFSADLLNATLLIRTINSANQLSIHGAILDWCDELTQQILCGSFSSMEKSVAKVNEQFVENWSLRR